MDREHRTGAPWGVVCAWLVCGCGGSSGPDSAAVDSTLVRPRANVVLISIDTLRADRLGCTGYSRDTSPRLDELARESLRLDRVYTQSQNTIISHATMLTSLYPVVHGVRPDHGLADSLTTLAERFRDAGYATAGFTAHGDWLCARKGFHQGFETFHAAFRPARSVNEDALRWLRAPARKSQPFFLFVHYYDVHSDWGNVPYETRTYFDRKFTGDPPGGFNGCRAGECGTRLLKKISEDPAIVNAAELAWIQARYDSGIAYTDHHIGVVLDELRARGLYDDTWIVVTSDHGEEFLEHGRMLHDQSYEEVARVPLLAKPPGGVEARGVYGLVGLVDLAPTLLEGVGLDLGAAMQGASFLPLLSGAAPDAGATVYLNDARDPENIVVWQEDHALLTRDGFERWELFDLASDPAQTRDVASEQPEVVERLLELARRFHEAQRSWVEGSEPTSDAVTADERARLRSLGYID